MSSVITPRSRSTAYSSSPKSSPTGPTTRTSQKKLAASEKCTAEPPSMRSRSPKGVFTASKAMEPTTVRLIRGPEAYPPPSHESHRDTGVRRSRGDAGRGPARSRARRRRAADPRLAGGNQLRRHPPAREHLPGEVRAAARAGRRGGGRRGAVEQRLQRG